MRWAARLAWTHEALSLPQCHGHAECGREPQLFHGDALNALRSLQVHRTIIKAIWQDVFVPFGAPHLQRIVNEAFLRATGLGSSDAAVHGIVERSCRTDIDVVETMSHFAFLLGLTWQKVDSAKPHRMLAQYGVRDSMHRRTCVG